MGPEAMMIMSAASSVVGFMQDMAAGAADKRAMDARARTEELNARIVSLQGQQDAQAIREEAERRDAGNLARAAGAYDPYGSPSYGALRRANKEDEEEALKRTLTNAELSQLSFEADASQSTLAGKEARTGALLKGAGTLFTGGMKVAELYKDSQTPNNGGGSSFYSGSSYTRRKSVPSMTLRPNY